jgi:putative sterol carrier protein
VNLDEEYRQVLSEWAGQVIIMAIFNIQCESMCRKFVIDDEKISRKIEKF